jgi:hypothetical protein
VKGFKKKKQ